MSDPSSTAFFIEGETLSPGVLKKYFAIVPSVRRANWDLFEKWMSKDESKNEVRFYELLSEHLSANPEWLFEFDQRMRDDRDYTKMFYTRFHRILPSAWQTCENILDIVLDEASDSEEVFAILRFFRRLKILSESDTDEDATDFPDIVEENRIITEKADNPVTVVRNGGEKGQGDSDPAGGAVSTDADWREILSQISAACAGMDVPDAGQAAFIAALAVRLPDACTAAAGRQNWAADFVARAAALGVTVPSDADLLCLGGHRADQIDALLNEIAEEVKAVEVASAECHALEHDAKVAADGKEFERASKLYAETATVRRRLQDAERRNEAMRASLATLLASNATAPAPKIVKVRHSDDRPKSPMSPSALDVGPSDPIPSDAAHVSLPITAPKTPSTPPILAKTEHSVRSRPAPAIGSTEELLAQAIPRTVEMAANQAHPTAVAAIPEHEAPQPLSAAITWADCARIDDLIETYLAQGELEFAHELAVLASARGAAALPPARLLKLLSLSRSIERPETVAGEEIRGTIIDATQAVANLEQGNANGLLTRCRALAFSALLRPALFDSHGEVRPRLMQLSLHDGLQQLVPLAGAIAELGFEFRLSLEDLVELTSHERQFRVPATRMALSQWLEEKSRARTSHQPTFAVLHSLLEPEGDIGGVIVSILEGSAQARNKTEKLLERLQMPDDYVARAALDQGRPRRDRITGSALEWITARLTECAGLLADWLAADIADCAVPDDQRREMLRRRIGTLQKTTIRVIEALGAQPPDLPHGTACALVTALQDFKELLAGVGSADPTPPSQRLRLKLLRAPKLCLPQFPDSVAYDDERRTQEDSLFRSLCAPESLAPDLRAALQARRTEGAAVAARECLEAAAAARLLRDPAAERQALEEAVIAWRDKARTRVQALHQQLAMFGNLDLSAGGDVRIRLDQLDAIQISLLSGAVDQVSIPTTGGLRNPLVPPDFPELEIVLDEMEQFANLLSARIRTDQQSRLSAIAREPARASAENDLAIRYDKLDLVTLDYVIAELEGGRDPLPPDEAAADLFNDYFPNFTNKLPGPRNLPMAEILRAASARRDLAPLEFSRLDEQQAGRARELVEAWLQLQGAQANPVIDRMLKPLTALLGLLGFIGIQLKHESTPVAGRLHVLRMNCETPRPARWFLPPAFGSKASGSYQVLVAAANVDYAQLTSVIGGAPDAAWLLLHFARLDSRARQTLGAGMRSDRRSAITLDESLLLHIATAGGDPLEALFACAAPFAAIEPYTTNPRNIPPEMFFGRQQEISLVRAQDRGGCLIYGGRQLGKSALLNQVRRLMHNRKIGQIAIYADIGDIGIDPIPADRVWERIARILRQEAEMRIAVDSPHGVADAIRSYLIDAPQRRILLMLDEADHFLAAEHPRYTNLRPMKDLMEETGWRFKVVLAGLHNVRRHASAPNSPLVHFGDPICIGPMNKPAANMRELRRLVREPMRAAGFDYETPELADDILARVNHYPSLVQVFCEQVIRNANSGTVAAGSGPRWNLSRESLFEGRLAENIAAEIRKRFQWTLDLDPRYDIVAKTLALHRLDSETGDTEVLRDGMAPADILDKVVVFWPNGLELPDIFEFRSLLEEMDDLGVLISKRPDRYGLRNAQVARMLGTRNSIEQELLELGLKEPQVAYDATIFHRQIATDNPDSVSPLTDRQLEILFAPAAGVRFVCASEAISGARIADRMLEIARDWRDDTGRAFEAVLVRGTAPALRKEIEKKRDRICVLLLEQPWDARTHTYLVEQEATKSGAVRPVWLLSLEQVRQLPDEQEVLIAAPFSEAMLRLWLARHGLARCDEPGTRTAIMQATGGAPTRLMVLRPQLATWAEDRVRRIGEWRMGQDAAQDMLKPSDVALRALADLAGLILVGESEPLVDAIEFCPDIKAVLRELTVASLIFVGPDDRISITSLGRLLVA